jgi:hypothetical protein
MDWELTHEGEWVPRTHVAAESLMIFDRFCQRHQRKWQIQRKVVAMLWISPFSEMMMLLTI